MQSTGEVKYGKFLKFTKFTILQLLLPIGQFLNLLIENIMQYKLFFF